MNEKKIGLSRRGFLEGGAAILGSIALGQRPLNASPWQNVSGPGEQRRNIDSTRIDVHFHYLPDFYREALVKAGISQPDGIPATPQWSEAASIEIMDRLGTQTAILSVSSPGVHFGDDAAARVLARRVNEEGARLAKSFPGRYGFFASTPLPDVSGAVVEVRYALDVLKADGVILETNFHGIYLGDEKLKPLYEELNQRKAVVFIHPTSPQCSCGCGVGAAQDIAIGYPRPMLEFIFETTRSVTNMILSGALERYRDISVIVPHAGAALPILAGRVQGLLPILNPQSQMNMRAELKRLHYDLAGAPVPELLGALLQIADHGRIHYGSDWPFTPAKSCEALTAQLDSTPLLNGDLRAAVMHGNALSLFSRLSR